MPSLGAAELFKLLKGSFDEYNSGDLSSGESPSARFLDSYSRWIGDDGNLSFRFDHGFITINNEYLENEIHNTDDARWFADACTERKIFELTFAPDVSADELTVLMEVFAKEAFFFSDHTVATQYLAAQNVKQIQANPPNLEDSFYGASPLSARSRFSAKQLEYTNDELVEPAHIESARSLFISNEDRERLSRDITGLIQEGALGRVAQALTLIRNDLRSSERMNRELGFSGYQVVIRTLIEKRQTKALYSIVKSMPFDLRICREPDLYAMHLDTFVDILEFFRGEHKYRPLIFGLTVLSEQIMRQTDNIKPLVKVKLEYLVTPRLVEILMRRADEDPSLKSYLQVLLKDHALGLLRPLLVALYEADNKHVRKIILDVLHGMGSVVYSDLLHDLVAAIDKDAPWYIKRNLLSVLAADPPKELEPLLARLEAVEEHPKVVGWLMRCRFLLHLPESKRKSLAMLESESDSRGLIKLIGYAARAGHSYYAKPLIDFAENHEDGKVRRAAVSALGRIRSHEAQDYLLAILNKSSLFKSKTLSAKRVAAAQSLSASHDPRLLSVLTRFTHDRDPEVRAVIQEMLQ